MTGDDRYGAGPNAPGAGRRRGRRRTVLMQRPMPPCMHSILLSMSAARGSQLNSALMRFHTLGARRGAVEAETRGWARARGDDTKKEAAHATRRQGARSVPVAAGTRARCRPPPAANPRQSRLNPTAPPSPNTAPPPAHQMPSSSPSRSRHSSLNPNSALMSAASWLPRMRWMERGYSTLRASSRQMLWVLGGFGAKGVEGVIGWVGGWGSERDHVGGHCGVMRAECYCRVLRRHAGPFPTPLAP